MAFRIQMTGLNEGFDLTLDGGQEFAISSSAAIKVVEGEPYEGEYEVVSLPFEDQELPTINKVMRDNLTVKAIPYEEVSNPQGGKTVTIGGY